jgi:peptidoglycan-associated lipoprotein
MIDPSISKRRNMHPALRNNKEISSGTGRIAILVLYFEKRIEFLCRFSIVLRTATRHQHLNQGTGMRDYFVGGGFVKKGRFFGMFAVAVLVAAMALFAGGCAKQQVRTDEEVRTTAPAPVEVPTERPVATGGEEPLASEAQPVDQLNISEGRTHAPMLPVYFDYDSSIVRADQRARIERNAAFLRDNPHVRIQIEGNCDDRGTNEYNMALGERRAMSAKNYLVNLGIAGNRIAIISYGEEKPLAFGQNEKAWAQNRRGDFVIGN